MTRQLRIDEILSLDREPSIQAWRMIEAGIDELMVAEEFGFSIEYLRDVFAKEFVHKLDSGLNILEIPRLNPELEELCWNHVAVKVGFGSPKNVESPLSNQFRLKLISLYKEGIPIQDIVKRFETDCIQIRAWLILALAEDGMTLNEIGDEFGLTRERARQLIGNLGISIRALRKSKSSKKDQHEINFLASIETWITEHPGCHLSEIAKAFVLDDFEIQNLRPKNLQRLVLRSNPRMNSNGLKTFTREQILDALKKAYDLRNPSISMYSVNETQPLTGPYYEAMRSSGFVYGPHRMRVLQVFGTWKAACEEAGVPSVEAVRDTYERRWTDDMLIEQIAEFISTSESSSQNVFDEWCRLDESRASIGTVKNQLGLWFDAYESALLLLRQRWTSN